MDSGKMAQISYALITIFKKEMNYEQCVTLNNEII